MHYGWNSVALKPERENFTPGKPMYRTNSRLILMLDALLALFRYKAGQSVIAAPAASREDRFIHARDPMSELGYESDRRNFPCFDCNAIDADVALLGMPNDMGTQYRPAPRRRDGQLLGPPHASHEEIRRSGGGRYSHWEGRLYFSSSDGSDPRTNGRRYAGARLFGRGRQSRVEAGEPTLLSRSWTRDFAHRMLAGPLCPRASGATRP
jgi:hypothetical protein